MSKLTTFFYNLIGDSPSFAEDDVFMNMGYTQTPESRNHSNTTKQQLYQQVVTEIDMENKLVLEVGCGRGGGAELLSKLKRPKKYLATDLSKSSVAFCKRKFNIDNLVFEEADAMNLPYPDNSFDVIINIESSHCYKNMKKFLSEVHRVLKPGGHFCFCDIRTQKKEKKTRKYFQRYFTINRWNDISKHTIGALLQSEIIVRQGINKITPGWKTIFRPLLNNWAGVPDTPVFNALKNGDLVYFWVQASK